MKKEKIGELDFLRTFAFIAVVMQHILGNYLRNTQTVPADHLLIGLLFGMFKFAVPLFVFLSGVVMFYNYYDGLHYFKFLKKRIVELIIPYVLWSFFYTLWVSRDFDLFNNIWLVAFLKSLVFGTARYHLWYVVMIFQCILFLPMIFFVFRFFQKRIHSTKGFTIVMLLFGLAYLAFLKYYYAIFCHFPSERLNDLITKIYTINFLSYAFFFILGGICGLYYLQWKTFIRKNFILFLSICLLLYLYVTYYAFSKDYADGVMNLNSFSSFNLRFFLFSIASIFTLYGIAMLLSRNENTLFGRTCAFIGKYSYDAYLAHAFVISIVSLFLIKFIPSHQLLLFYAVVVILTIVLSLVLGFVTRKAYQFVLPKKRIKKAAPPV